MKKNMVAKKNTCSNNSCEMAVHNFGQHKPKLLQITTRHNKATAKVCNLGHSLSLTCIICSLWSRHNGLGDL